MLRRALDIGEQGGVVARTEAGQMRLHHRTQRRSRPAELGRVLLVAEQLDRAIGQERRLVRQLAAVVVRAGQLLRLDLARLDVRLIERVDPDDRPGHRRRELPQEERLAKLQRVGELDPHDRLAGLGQRLDRLVLRRVGASVRRR